MRVALITSFVASRKEALLAMMDRVYQGFVDAGIAEPTIRFNFGDAQIGGGVSSVDRVLKRHPELSRFVTDAAPDAWPSGRAAHLERAYVGGRRRKHSVRDDSGYRRRGSAGRSLFTASPFISMRRNSASSSPRPRTPRQ